MDALVVRGGCYGGRFCSVLGAVGRLADGVTVEQAQADLSSIAVGLASEYPDTNRGRGILVQTLRDEVIGDVRGELLILFAAVGLVLLVACGNLTNLVLARSLDREAELAVRSALGAGRRRLIRQSFTEVSLLGVMGGGAGLILAIWGTDALLRLIPDNLPRLGEVGPIRRSSSSRSWLCWVPAGWARSFPPYESVEEAWVEPWALAAAPVPPIASATERAAFCWCRSSVSRWFFWWDPDCSSAASRRSRRPMPVSRVTPFLLASLLLPRSEYDEARTCGRLPTRSWREFELFPASKAVALTYDHPLQSN